jgi:hypothetical protein
VRSPRVHVAAAALSLEDELGWLRLAAVSREGGDEGLGEVDGADPEAGLRHVLAAQADRAADRGGARVEVDLLPPEGEGLAEADAREREE